MMSSPALNYPSPRDGHTSIGSPAPSQILLHRVASPNHISQHSYVDSPRSVPTEFSQPYSSQTEQSFEYAHTPEEYAAEDPHIYDFGPNGPLPIDAQFAQPQLSHPQPTDPSNLLFVQQPGVQIQPPTPMHGQFVHGMPHAEHRSMTPFSDAGTDYSIGSPDMNGGHLIDISANGFQLPTHYMTLPRSHPMQDRAFYDAPVFDEDGYDSRSPSPSGIRDAVKRPLNAFMLYRKDKQGGIPTSNHQSVSRIIGAMWKNESADTKAKYNALAQQEREKHRLAYPGYKYSPKKRINKDKKVRRTMSQAAHAKRAEEETNILKAINKRSASEGAGTLARPLPEFLPIPKSRQRSMTPDCRDKDKSKSADPAAYGPRLIPQPRSHSAQPPSIRDYSKFTSNPQQPMTSVPRKREDTPEIHVPQPYGQHHHLISDQQNPYYPYQVDYAQLTPQPAEATTNTTPFDSESDSFTREFSAEAGSQAVCSPAPFTPIDEMQLYGHSFAGHDDLEIFRMSSPFAGEKELVDPRLHNTVGVQSVFAGHWSRESTVNPQDIFGQLEDA